MTENQIELDDHHAQVSAAYAEASRKADEGCCGPNSSCLSPVPIASERLGYSEEEMAMVPDGANLGLGCGNPTAIASLKPGDVVLDLGSGGGFDCFLAAKKVGNDGRVIGIDMTDQMLARAQKNAKKVGAPNVEFIKGAIEALPVPDGTADIIISNCVINLSDDKESVFRETFRALKAGGRLCISDVVATQPIPKDMASDMHLVSCCIGGAAHVDDLNRWMKNAGFETVRIDINEESRAYIADWAPGRGVENYVVSALIEAKKPDGGCC